MIWLSPILAGASVIAGPVFSVFYRSDLGQWSGADAVLASAFAFHPIAAFGYVVASSASRADTSALRTTIAAAGCLFILLVTTPIWAAMGLAITDFGLARNHFAIAIIFGVLAVPTALFQVLAMGRGIALATLEFLAHLIAAGGPFLVRWLLSQPTEGTMGERLFEEWPDLLALTPFVALAVARATSVPLRQLCYAPMIAAAPIYVGIALSDFIGGSGLKSMVWPARVWSEFTNTKERADLIAAVATIRPGVPARIGHHWYQFERPGIQTNWPRTANVRRPDRIVYVQLPVRADDVGLPEMQTAEDPYVLLNIRVASPVRPSPDDLESRGEQVAIAVLDLVVDVGTRGHSNVERAKVREKLRRFMEDARVEPPPGAG